MLREAVRVLRWTVGKEEGAPDAGSGRQLAFALVTVIVLSWILRVVIHEDADIIARQELNPIVFVMLLIRAVFVHPREVAPAFLLASILPSVIALLKLSTANIVALTAYRRNELPSGTPPSFAITLTLFDVLNLAASLITLSTIVPGLRRG